MKFCPNYSCVAYGRVTYTQSTRCAFCRWDLKPPRLKSETLTDQQINARSHQNAPPASPHVRSTPRLRIRLKPDLLTHSA